MFNICTHRIVFELYLMKEERRRKKKKEEERRKKKKEEERRKKMNKIEIFMFGFLDFAKC